MIDLQVEKVFPISELPAKVAELQSGVRPFSVSRVYQWTVRGCKGVVLDSLQFGGSRVTSVEAFFRFVKALTAARDEESPSARAPAIIGKRRVTREASLVALGV